MNDVLRTLGNGLTYEGQWLHILINYLLIILTVMPFVLGQNLLAKAGEHQGWKLCLVIITLLQVAVWFMADAIGVSLIWSAMTGFLVLGYWRGEFAQTNQQKRLAQFALTAACAALLYYAIAFPAITTVAHAVAVLVGMSLFLLLPRRGSRV